MAQQEGELQHTKQPLTVFPVSKLFVIITDDALRRDITALPLLRTSLQAIESTFSLLPTDEDLIDIDSVLMMYYSNNDTISCPMRPTIERNT
jgi:hypothetical protein